MNSSLSIGHYGVSVYHLSMNLSIIFTLLLVRVEVMNYFGFTVALVYYLFEALIMVSLIMSFYH